MSSATSSNPFITSADEEMEMWFLFIDMDADQNYVLGNDLTYNKIQFSFTVNKY